MIDANDLTVTKVDYAKRWKPLLTDMPTDTAFLCAWVMEQEAWYLRDNIVDNPEQRLRLASGLKFVFPVIRLAMREFSVLDRVAHGNDQDQLGCVVQRLVNQACKNIDATDMRPGFEPEPGPPYLHEHELIVGLGQRLASSIISYQELA